jgi:hypothetical protein
VGVIRGGGNGRVVRFAGLCGTIPQVSAKGMPADKSLPSPRTHPDLIPPTQTQMIGLRIHLAAAGDKGFASART